MAATKTVTSVEYSPNQPKRIEAVLLEELTDTSYTVLDLTGASLITQVRPSLKNATVIVEASTANGKITIEPVTTIINGSEVTETGIVISFTAQDTLDIYNQTIGDFAESDLQLTLPAEDPLDGVMCFQYTACVFNTRDYDLRECCP